MPTLKHRLPAYRLFKPRNLACVTIDGKRVYLGPYGSPESRAEYARLIAELEQRGRRPHVPSRRELCRAKAAAEAAADPVPLTIVELVDRFLAHAVSYYRKPDGTAGNEATIFKSALRPVVRLYGRLPARKFRPRHLKAVRESLVRDGWKRVSKTGRTLSGQYSRTGINALLRRIKHVFAWAVEEELVRPAVYEGVRRVRSLRRGKTDAIERKPVRAVDDLTVERTLPHLRPIVADMVRLQRLTGARPGEICDLRPADVTTSGDVWVYRPAHHKTEAHGHERCIPIGPRGQAILRPYLLRPAEAFCFSPADSERARKRELRENRQSKVQPSQIDRSSSKPQRQPGQQYKKDAYNRAIMRAVQKANRLEVAAAAAEGREPVLLVRWCPNQLRHAKATELRREHGVEAAQTILGHADPKTTLIYAEADQKLAADVARRTG